jgi:phage-related baseplate assembly protein
MAAPNPFANLPPISFCVTDVAALQNAVVQGFQNAWYADTGERITLTLADRRTNFLYSLINYLVQDRQLIDVSAKQNLLPFAGDGFIDNLAVIFGPLAARLPAAGAVTTLQFTLQTVNAVSSSLIPKGTTVQSSSTSLVFATNSDLVIPAGFSHGFIAATCTTAGAGGNGLLPGDLAAVTGWTQPFNVSVTNTEATIGGADTETTEAYRIRLYTITDSYSPAGPKGRYKSYAQAVSSAIADVSVMGPEDGLNPGEVVVTLLLQNGAFPNQALIDQVYAFLNGDTVRDFCAHLTVAAPAPVAYSVTVKWWNDITYTGDLVALQLSVNAAVNNWILNNKTALGGSINPSTLVTAVRNAGASYCEVPLPARIQLQLNQVGQIVDDPVITYMGSQQDFQV